jgi:hypothetical protein
MAWAGTLGGALATTLRSGVPTEPITLDHGLAELCGFAADMRATVPGGVDDDVGLIEAAFSGHTPWLAYCPGDTCPDNNRVLPDGSVRFFDFEGAGWRHAALEAAYCVAPFCTCWCVASLPEGVTAAMEAAFLEALDPPQPEAFREQVVLAAVSYTLLTFGHFRRFVIERRPVGPPDRTPCDGPRYVLLRLATMASQGHRIPALRRVGRSPQELDARTLARDRRRADLSGLPVTVVRDGRCSAPAASGRRGCPAAG